MFLMINIAPTSLDLLVNTERSVDSDFSLLSLEMEFCCLKFTFLYSLVVISLLSGQVPIANFETNIDASNKVKV